MKYTFTLLILLIVACQPKSTGDSSERIRELMQQQQLAWNRGDIEGFMNTYWKSDSLKFVSGNTEIYGWDNMLQRYKKRYPGKEAMGELEFAIDTVLNGSSGWASVRGEWLVQTDTGSTGGFFTLHWRSINGQWRIVYDHTS